MVIEYRHIRLWLCSMMVLLCLACSSDSDDVGESPDVKKPSQLEIRVYMPKRTEVTRAEKIDPEADETAVYSLDIWVFEHDSGVLAGHLSPVVSESFEGGTYQMTVNDDFAKRKPNVDVFAMVNVHPNNTGINWPSPITRADLTNAVIQHVDDTHDYFGFNNAITAPPAEGLPMSGALYNTAVVGSQPVLRVETKVTVVRAVSKIRFVFSRTEQKTEFGENQELKIVSITINNDKIPKAEYLFLANDYNTENLSENCHVVTTGESSYESGTDDNGRGIALLTEYASRIPEYANPSEYSYTGEVTGQEYENLINSGIEANPPHLAEVGKFYLRESDKQVTGRIHYTIGNDQTVKSSTFSMARAGDFSRNHTWIVYGYFSGKELLSISSVNVLPWNTEYWDYIVPNW